MKAEIPQPFLLPALPAVVGRQGCWEARPRGTEHCWRAAELVMNQLPEAAGLPRAVRLLPGAARATRAPGETGFLLQWKIPPPMPAIVSPAPPDPIASPVRTLPLPPPPMDPRWWRGIDPDHSCLSGPSLHPQGLRFPPEPGSIPSSADLSSSETPPGRV